MTDILEVEAEHEVLYDRLVQQVIWGFENVLRTPPADEVIGFQAGVAVTAVLRALRVMSARQMAVVVAEKANRGIGYTIHEPPRYTAEERAEVEE